MKWALSKLLDAVTVTGFPAARKPGHDVRGTMLTLQERMVVDGCIEALIAGIAELPMTLAEFHVLRTVHDGAPRAVDAYAAKMLPRRLWGVELRVVYGSRPQSSCVCFCETRSVTDAQWAAAKIGAVGLARDLRTA